MNKLLLILPIAVLLVAGCINLGGGGTTATSGLGLEISDFSSDLSEVYSNKSARIFMEVENQGQGTVKNMTMSLIGPINSSGDDFWRNATRLDVNYTNIKPADPVRDLPAEKKREDWKLTAPILVPGQTREDLFIGRVYYGFESKATGTIWIYPESEADSVRNSGGQLDKASFVYTVAPVSIEVTTAPSPPVVSSGDTSFTMLIKLENVGGGTIFNESKWTTTTLIPTLDSGDLNIVNISVSAPGLSPTGCQGKDEMIGNSLTLYCDLDVGSTSIPTTKKSVPVTVTIAYGYYKDAELTLKALGK